LQVTPLARLSVLPDHSPAGRQHDNATKETKFRLEVGDKCAAIVDIQPALQFARIYAWRHRITSRQSVG
jgi:hypothetical protein